MYPEPTDWKSGDWGALWVLATVARTGTSGQAYLFESVGAAVLTQVQMMLENGTLPTDRLYDGNVLGTERTRVDGIWGPRTLRQLWAYTKRAYELGLLGSGTSLADRLAPIRRSIDGRTLDPTLFLFAQRLLWFTKRLLRRPGQPESVQPARFAALVGDGTYVRVGALWQPSSYPAYGEVIPYTSSLDVLDAQPTYRVLSTAMPPVPAVLQADWGGLVVQGEAAPSAEARGPWTLAPGQTAPVWNSGTPVPVGREAPGTGPKPPPSTGGDGAGGGAGSGGGGSGGAEQPPPTGLSNLAGSVADVGRAALPYAAGVSAAVGLGAVVWALWPKPTPPST